MENGDNQPTVSAPQQRVVLKLIKFLSDSDGSTRVLRDRIVDNKQLTPEVRAFVKKTTGREVFGGESPGNTVSALLSQLGRKGIFTKVRPGVYDLNMERINQVWPLLFMKIHL